MHLLGERHQRGKEGGGDQRDFVRQGGRGPGRRGRLVGRSGRLLRWRGATSVRAIMSDPAGELAAFETGASWICMPGKGAVERGRRRR